MNRRDTGFPILCWIAVTWLLASSLGWAQTNWPSFRGAEAKGIATGPATVTVWDGPKCENILWKTVIPGLGHSSPIIWGDQLFVTTAANERKTSELKVGLYGDPGSADDNEKQQWKVICLNKQNGVITWQATAHEGTPRVKRHPKATHANCTMSTDGRHVVAFFGSEGLYCYDMKGQLEWKKDLGTLRASPVIYNDAPDTNGFQLEWGFASSPVLHGNRVYVQCDGGTNGFIAAFEVGTGKEVWRSQRDDTATWSTPNIYEEGERPQLLVNGWRHMGGYDLESGREIWRMSGGGDCPVPTPVVWRDLFFFMSAHGPRSPIYAVRRDATGDISLKDGALTNAHVAWSVRRGGAYMQTPIIDDDMLYSCQMDGILSCYEARTGKQIYKERLGTGGAGFTASPVASAGNLYFTSEQGAVYVVKGGPEFKVVRTNQLGEVCLATPAISEGKLFFRTERHIMAIGKKLN